MTPGPDSRPGVGYRKTHRSVPCPQTQSGSSGQDQGLALLSVSVLVAETNGFDRVAEGGLYQPKSPQWPCPLYSGFEKYELVSKDQREF